jgi:hypothetical protein
MLGCGLCRKENGLCELDFWSFFPRVGKWIGSVYVEQGNLPHCQEDRALCLLMFHFIGRDSMCIFLRLAEHTSLSVAIRWATFFRRMVNSKMQYVRVRTWQLWRMNFLTFWAVSLSGERRIHFTPGLSNTAL